jgi:hypothetical protein
MTYSIRYNLRTAHLQGVAPRTVYTGDGEDNGSGVVPYYAESACSALSRSGARFADRPLEATTLVDAVRELREFATDRGLKICSNCERAAEASIASAADIAERQAASDAAQAELARARAEQAAPAPFGADHAAAVTKLRANLEAEDEARAAARRARNRTNYAPAPTAENKAAAAERPLGQVYKVTNPLTGAVEFPIKVAPSRLVGWAGYFRNAFGRAQHLGWSNADTEAAALDEIKAGNSTGTDYAVAPAKPVTLNECKSYLARRAALAPTKAKRAKWARILTNAAIDYLRTGYGTDDCDTAKAHLAGLVDDALRSLGDKWEVQRMHVDWSRRIMTRADNAARMFLIVERDLDNHPRPEAVEYRLTQYLERRDDLIHELEAVTAWS